MVLIQIAPRDRDPRSLSHLGQSRLSSLDSIRLSVLFQFPFGFSRNLLNTVCHDTLLGSYDSTSLMHDRTDSPSSFGIHGIPWLSSHFAHFSFVCRHGFCSLSAISLFFRRCGKPNTNHIFLFARHHRLNARGCRRKISETSLLAMASS